MTAKDDNDLPLAAKALAVFLVAVGSQPGLTTVATSIDRPQPMAVHLRSASAGHRNATNPLTPAGTDSLSQGMRDAVSPSQSFF